MFMFIQFWNRNFQEFFSFLLTIKDSPLQKMIAFLDFFFKFFISLLIISIEWKFKFFVVKNVFFLLFHFSWGLNFIIFTLFTNFWVWFCILKRHFRLNLDLLSVLILLVIHFDPNVSFNVDYFTNEKCRNESCTVLSSCFSFFVILLHFGRVLGNHTMDLLYRKCVGIMFGNKLSVSQFLFNLRYFKIVWCIFGILDQLPNPS